jgi:hypothetical protein
MCIKKRSCLRELLFLQDLYLLKEAGLMNFRKITLDDKHIFGKFGYICSDYLFSYLYMYNELYKLKMAERDGAVIIRSDMDTACFYIPLGNIRQGIEAVLEYCGISGISPVFSKIPKDYTGVFRDYGFIVEEDRDSFDYIFRNSDFIKYEGKKFRNQRNNMSSYIRTFLPEFDERVEMYVDECKAFTLRYHNTEEKLEPTYKMLDCIADFNLKGGVVLENNEVAAFCLYEKVSDYMVQSHVELTNNNHRGVHAYLINELAKRMDAVYINKEDDMGLPGLRRFKEKYNPCDMLKKYKAIMK